MANDRSSEEMEGEARRLSRATWPVRRFAKGYESNEDLSLSTSVEERIAMMWPLALDAFGIGAPPRPPTARHIWPVTVRRLGDPEPR